MSLTCYELKREEITFLFIFVFRIFVLLALAHFARDALELAHVGLAHCLTDKLNATFSQDFKLFCSKLSL